MSKVIDREADSTRPAATEVTTQVSSISRRPNMLTTSLTSLDDSSDDVEVQIQSTRRSVKVSSESDSEYLSDSAVKSAQSSRNTSQLHSGRKPSNVRAQQKRQSSSGAQSKAVSTTATVNAKRSLSSALGSGDSGGSAPKRARSAATVTSAQSDTEKRDKAKIAGLQLRCNRLGTELQSAELRASAAGVAQRQLAEARQAAESAEQSRRRLATQLHAEKQHNRRLQTRVNELHSTIMSKSRFASSSRPASVVAPSRPATALALTASSTSARTSMSTSASGQPQGFSQSSNSQTTVFQTLVNSNRLPMQQVRKHSLVDLCSPSLSTVSSVQTELLLSPPVSAQLSITPSTVEFPFADVQQPGEFIRVASINLHGMGRWRTGDTGSIDALFLAMQDQLIDIACLQETWLRPDDAAVSHLQGRAQFTFINAPRLHQSLTRACGSGGVAMLIRTDHWDSITRIKAHSDQYETLWVKFKRGTFVLFVASVYRPPFQNSQRRASDAFSLNPMDSVCADVCELSQQGSVVVCGDFNHRIGTLPSHVPHKPSCARLTRDTVVEPDVAAREFVAQCNAAGLLIMNGLFGSTAELTNICAGQVRSHSTSVPASVVDLVCLHSNDTHLLDVNRGLEVTHLPSLSPEHGLLVLPLFLASPMSAAAAADSAVDPGVHQSKPANRLRCSFAAESPDALLKRMHQLIDDVSKAPSSSGTADTDVESAAKQLESSVVSALSDCATLTPVKGKPSGLLQMPKSAELRAATKEKNALLSAIKASVDSPESSMLERFRSLNARVKQLHRTEFERWHESLMAQLRAYKVAGDAKQYWLTLKRMACWSSGRKQISTAQVIHQGRLLSGRNTVFNAWRQAFANELSESEQSAFCSGIGGHQRLVQRLVELALKRDDSSHALNAAMSNDEVLTALRQSHSGKAAGADNIPMEAYKWSTSSDKDQAEGSVNPVLRSIVRLFNLIWSQEQLPESWSHSLIMPLFKSGDARDPLNWRPIALIPSIAKLFSTVLHNRLEDWCESGGKLSQNQFGFRRGLSTAEPLFILSETLDCYVIERRLPLYVCFIDVRKAYDLLWRDGLIARLHVVGVRGTMLRVIRHMLNNTSASVLINEAMTEPIGISNGVKQGDNLSPLLFNIFFDSLSHRLNATTSPAIPSVSVGSVHFNHLMYADDLMLIADHPASLQTLLSLTAEHFRKWRMTLNFAKTKVVAFDRQPALRSNVELDFVFGERPIEVAESYTYLGVLFTNRLNFKLHKANRIQAALSRMHRLHWMRRKGHLMHIRDSLEAHEMLLMSAVESAGHVCSYGRQAWPALDQLLHHSACKMLEVSTLSTHLALRGEIGWLTSIERSDRAHLMYVNRLAQSKSANQLARRVLMARREMATQGTNRLATVSWCCHVMRLVRKYGLEKELKQLDESTNSVSASESVDNQRETQSSSWNSAVKNKVQALSEQRWITQCEQMPKLVTYCLVKSALRLEPYLTTESSRQSAILLTQLRCGTNGLAVDRLRRSINGVLIPRSDRVCLNCDNDSAVVEDESHVLLHCPRFVRHRLWLHEATLSLS